MKSIFSRATRVLGKICFWRKTRAVEERQVALCAADVERILESALRRQRSELSVIFSDVLREHSVAISKPLEEFRSCSATAQKETSAAFESLRGELQSLREIVSPSLAAIDERGAGVDASVKQLEESTTRLSEMCGAQVESFDKQIVTTRDSLSALQESYDERLREVGNGHIRERQHLEAERDRQSSKNTELRSLIDRRVKSASTELERVAERLSPKRSIRRAPVEDPRGTTQGFVRRSVSRLLTPVRNVKLRFENRAPARETLLLEQARLRALKAQLEAVLDGSEAVVPDEPKNELQSPSIEGNRAAPDAVRPYAEPLVRGVETLC